MVNVASRMSAVGHIHINDPHLTKTGSFSSVQAYGQSKLCQVTHPATYGLCMSLFVVLEQQAAVILLPYIAVLALHETSCFTLQSAQG